MQDRIGYPRPILLVVHGAGLLGVMAGIARGPGHDRSLVKYEALKLAVRTIGFGSHVEDTTLDNALHSVLPLPSLTRRLRTKDIGRCRRHDRNEELACHSPRGLCCGFGLLRSLIAAEASPNPPEITAFSRLACASEAI